MESGGGFFTTIQNIMAVAADRAYLKNSVLAFLDLASFRSASRVVTIETRRSAYQVKIYCE